MESQTLLERIVLLLRLPYPVAAAIFALWLPIGRLMYNLVGTADLAQAFDLAFLQPEWAALWQRIVVQVLGFATVFYALLVVRYMHRKVTDGEKWLAPLLKEGAGAYRKAFSPLTRTLPPVIIGGLLLGTGLLLSGPPAGPLEVLIFLPPQIVIYLAYGTWGWVYFAGLGGLHRLAKKQLRLKPFYLDRMLGTRPVGTLSLSLAAAFYGLMAILTVQFPLSPEPDPLPIFIFNLVAISTPGVLGAVAFLLPLNLVHKKLVRAKQREREAVRARVTRVLETFMEDGETEPTLRDVQSLVAADLAERRAATILTWPVSSRILGRFFIATMTLVAAVLARVILYVLQF